MSAVTKEEIPPKRKGAAEVAAFQKKYAEALEEARGRTKTQEGQSG